MEAIVLTALVGAGYLFMKPAPDSFGTGDAGRPGGAVGAGGGSGHAALAIPITGRRPVLASNEGPSGMPSVTYTDARDEELRRAQRLERAAAYHDSGLVDARARMIGTERGSQGGRHTGYPGDRPGDYPGDRQGDRVMSTLTGMDMPTEDFAHNNMVPFFGSQLHGLDLERDNGRFVESMSGAPGIGNLRDRTERAPLFAPGERGLGNVFGNPSATDALQARTPVSAIRNNDLPFQQIKVGAGVRAGSAGAGQLDNRDYALPKSVDELRPGNRPKADLDTSAHVLPGFDKSGAARPWQGLVQKQRPETAFDNDRGNLPTASPLAAQTVRARYEPRGDVLYHDSTDRGFNPGSSRVSALAPSARPESQFDRRLANGAPPLLNVAMADRGPGCADGLLGREGFMPGGADSASGGLRETGRSIMNARSAETYWDGSGGHGGQGGYGGPQGGQGGYGGQYGAPGYQRTAGPASGNATFPVSRGVVPFSDEMRTTQREFTELSPATGPAVPVGPPRLPLYTGEHAPRTTLREATAQADPGFARGFASPAASGLGVPCGPGDPGGDATRTTLRQSADSAKALENSVRNVRNTAYGGDTSGGLQGAEPFTPGPTVREFTEVNVRDTVPTGGSIVSGAGGAGGYAALVDGHDVGGDYRRSGAHAFGGGGGNNSANGGSSTGANGGLLVGEADGDGRLRAPATHRQFTGQVASSEGVSLRPARPEPSGYGIAHRQAELTSTTAGGRGEGGPGYFAAPRNEHTRPLDYGQIYASTVNSAKESLVRSRERAGHAGAARGPEVSTAGSVSAQAGLPDSGRASAPQHVTQGGEQQRSRGSVALRGEGPQSDRLADADAVLSWTATNPLVPR